MLYSVKRREESKNSNQRSSMVVLFKDHSMNCPEMEEVHSFIPQSTERDVQITPL